MLDQDTIVVGGDEMVIESLPVTDALRLITRTIKIVGGLGKGITDFPTSVAEFKKLSEDKNLENYIHLGGMVEGLLDRLDSEEVPLLIKNTIKASLPLYRDRPISGEGSFDQWYENRFSREFGDLFCLLLEIFKYNYGGPVEWLAGFFSATPEKDQSPPEPGPQEQS